VVCDFVYAYFYVYADCVKFRLALAGLVAVVVTVLWQYGSGGDSIVTVTTSMRALPCAIDRNLFHMQRDLDAAFRLFLYFR
jgi:hypothetical protein